MIAAALMLRALIPAGYMIAPAAESRQIFVTVCSGLEGKVTRIALPAKPGHGSQQDDHQGKDSPCAFTALAGLADLPQVAALVPPRAVLAAPGLERHTVSIGRGLAAPPPPQTGPPLNA